MLVPPSPSVPTPPARTDQRPICLDAVLVSEQALFRLVALLHRKQLPVQALLVQSSARPGHGGRLRLAVLPGNAQPAHVVGLIRAIVGITDVQMTGPTSLPATSRRCQTFLLNGSARPSASRGLAVTAVPSSRDSLL